MYFFESIGERGGFTEIVMIFYNKKRKKLGEYYISYEYTIAVKGLDAITRKVNILKLLIIEFI